MATMRTMTNPSSPEQSPARRSAEGSLAVPAVGAGVDEELERLQERQYQAVVPTILVVLLALFEWFRWWYPSQGEPLIFTLFALVAVGYTGWHLLASRRTYRSLWMARDGEWRMGRALERLREQGYRIFHEVPGPEGTLDHVLIGPAGLFALHTPGGEDLRLDADGSTSGPLALAKAQAKWLTDLVARRHPTPVAARPIVIFPGRRIQPSSPDDMQMAKHKVWVLNEHSLPVVLDQEPVRLDTETIQNLAAALGTYLKS